MNSIYRAFWYLQGLWLAFVALQLLGDAFGTSNSSRRPNCAQHLLAACNVWHALQRASLNVLCALQLLLVVRWLHQLFSRRLCGKATSSQPREPGGQVLQVQHGNPHTHKKKHHCKQDSITVQLPACQASPQHTGLRVLQPPDTAQQHCLKAATSSPVLLPAQIAAPAVTAPAPAAAPLAAPAPAPAECCPAADSSVMDVWVLAGQSNCVGTNQADGQDMPAAAAPWPGRIFCVTSSGGSWKDAVPNVHLGVYGYADADSCGPDMAFARTLIHTGVARKVGLVPTACGGTNLYEQWAPGRLLWSNMVQDTAAAMESLGSRGRLAGIVWVQGESDAFNLQTATAYGMHFATWLSATRAALASYAPCVPLVMAVMATRQRQDAFPYIDIVAQQQRALKLPGLLKVDMAGYEFYDGGDGNLLHLTKAGCCALGAAMASQVAAAHQPAVGEA